MSSPQLDTHGVRYGSPGLVPASQPCLRLLFLDLALSLEEGACLLSHVHSVTAAAPEVRSGCRRARGPCVTAAVHGPDRRSPLSGRSKLFRGSRWSSGRDFWASAAARRSHSTRLHRLRKTCIIELKTLPVLVYPDHTLWVLLLQQLSGGKFNPRFRLRLGAEHLSRNRWKQTQMRPRSHNIRLNASGGPLLDQTPSLSPNLARQRLDGNVMERAS